MQMQVEATADEGFVNTNQDPAFRDAGAMKTSSDGAGPTSGRWVFTNTVSPGIPYWILRAGGSLHAAAMPTARTTSAQRAGP